MSKGNDNVDLESMIRMAGDSLNQELDFAENALPEIPNIRLNYAEVHDEITVRATEMIETIAKKYHDINSTYIRDKIELDSTLYASTLFHLRTGEFAIKTIVEDINAGNNTSSVFGSLDRMQKVNAEIIKNAHEQIIIIEQKYKVLQALDGNAEVEQSGTGMTGLIEDGGFISLGTKKLLQHLTGLDETSEAHVDRQFTNYDEEVGDEDEESLPPEEDKK